MELGRAQRVLTLKDRIKERCGELFGYIDVKSKSAECALHKKSMHRSEVFLREKREVEREREPGP